MNWEEEIAKRPWAAFGLAVITGAVVALLPRRMVKDAAYYIARAAVANYLDAHDSAN